MVDQAQVAPSQTTPQPASPNGRTELPPRAVARSTAEFLHDVTTLAELQGKLTLVDLQAGVGKLIFPTAMVCLGTAIGLGCVPIALAAIALTLTTYTTLPPPACFGIALAVGVVLSTLLTIPALMTLKKGGRMFDRSLAEWRRNRQWAKDMLKRLGQHNQGVPTDRAAAGRWQSVR